MAPAHQDYLNPVRHDICSFDIGLKYFFVLIHFTLALCGHLT